MNPESPVPVRYPFQVHHSLPTLSASLVISRSRFSNSASAKTLRAFPKSALLLRAARDSEPPEPRDFASRAVMGGTLEAPPPQIEEPGPGSLERQTPEPARRPCAGSSDRRKRWGGPWSEGRRICSFRKLPKGLGKLKGPLV